MKEKGVNIEEEEEIVEGFVTNPAMEGSSCLLTTCLSHQPGQMATGIESILDSNPSFHLTYISIAPPHLLQHFQPHQLSLPLP